MRENVKRAQRQRAPGAGDRLRQELNVQKRMPKVPGRFPVADQPRRIKHEGRNAGNQNEGNPRRQSVNPSGERTNARAKFVPEVIEREPGNDLQKEEAPFDRPAERKDANPYLPS